MYDCDLWGAISNTNSISNVSSECFCSVVVALVPRWRDQRAGKVAIKSCAGDDNKSKYVCAGLRLVTYTVGVVSSTQLGAHSAA